MVNYTGGLIWMGWTSVCVNQTGLPSTWVSWVNSSTNAPGPYSNAGTVVWIRWNVDSNTEPAVSAPLGATYYHSPLPESEETKEQRLLQQQEAFEALRRYEEECKVAVERAETLLRMFLTEEQLAELERNKCFHVTAPSGTCYQIGRGRMGNVSELGEGGKKIRRYCIHPHENIPDPDTMLAQKLMLETDENLFKEIANVTHQLVV